MRLNCLLKHAHWCAQLVNEGLFLPSFTKSMCALNCRLLLTNCRRLSEMVAMGEGGAVPGAPPCYLNHCEPRASSVAYQ